MKKAVFFDRDNTLTKDAGYCYKIADFAWMPEADKALKRLADAAIPVFIVTNQGGIAKQLFSLADMHAFHAHLSEMAQQAGGHITGIAFCPHHPDAIAPDQRHCDCRKPHPKLFHDLAKQHDIDLSASIMIGDKHSDIEAGKAAGCHSYLYDRTSSLDRLVKQVMLTHVFQ